MPTEAEIQAAAAAEKDKVVFTPEQQEKVNQLIKDAMGRAGRENQQTATQAQAELTRVQAELAKAQTELAAAKTSGQKKEAKGEIEALQAQVEEVKRIAQQHLEAAEATKKALSTKDTELQSARREAQDIRKDVVIANVTSKLNFVNSEVVSKLTKDNITWDADKGRFVVVGPDGGPRLNASMDPMSLEEFYVEFAAANPYLVRGDVKSGIGSKENGNQNVSKPGTFAVEQIFGPKSSSILANKLAKENPQEYRRLRGIAVQNGILAG